MKDRIKKLRKRLDMTQQEFAEKVGVKRNTIGQYEIGRNEPIDAVISLICREFNVNEEWLRTGKGEMFNPAPTDVLDQLAEKYKLSNADYIMIEKFVSLRPEIRQNIYDYFQDVVSAFAYEDIEPHKMASPKWNIDESSEAEMARVLQECLEAPPPEESLEELEAEYKKSRSVSAPKKGSSALNITAEADAKTSGGIHRKISGK